MNEPRGRFTVRAVSNYADASAPAAKRWWELVESPRPTAEQAQAGTEISFAEPAPLSPSSPTGPTTTDLPALDWLSPGERSRVHAAILAARGSDSDDERR